MSLEQAEDAEPVNMRASLICLSSRFSECGGAATLRVEQRKPRGGNLFSLGAQVFRADQ
jgi:hypothetical protein